MNHNWEPHYVVAWTNLCLLSLLPEIWIESHEYRECQTVTC